jgi:hypothetical protein
MKQPRRLHTEAIDDLERAVLASWRSGGPSADSKRRALASLGAGLGTGLSVATVSNAASGAAAGSVGGSIAPKAATLVLSSTLKLVVAGSVGLASATAVLYRATSVPPPADTPAAVASPSPPSPAAPEPVAPREPAPIEVPRQPAALPMTARTTPPRAPATASSPELRTELHDAAAHPSIAEELASLDEAREALRGGDASRALRVLDGHDARNPDGALSQEATVVRVQALLLAGDGAGAATVGRRFLDAHPASPYAAQVRRIIQGAN